MFGQSVDVGCFGERVAKASDGGLEIVDADEQDVGPVGGGGEGDQDEPTGNLDSTTSYEIMGVLEQIHRAGNTIILVTHEEDIAKYAHRIIRLMDGKVSADYLNTNIITPSGQLNN